MPNLNGTLAPGARILVRDEEWLVRRVDRTSTGGQSVSVTGLSELVRDTDRIFLTEIEPQIDVLDPADTKLVADNSPFYRASLLYIESLLRQTPPTDDRLYIGHKAAMEPAPYQLEPALIALEQPRQRILIADAVGLGKTLEAGVLLAELIRRGRGKRILAVTLKSMLTQFQKELWSRFTIPLVRLDSVGIQRVRSRIPTNHNPFYYYDKSIISIDTLKQDSEYRTFIESAYWDIIVIDEAHNVADRGTGALRAKLAKLLAERSDTLIMLTATPHDGRARSFASIVNMLDPTAIANPDDYTKEEIVGKGLFIRRFKKDIQHEVTSAFKERQIHVFRTDASAQEEAAFDALVETPFGKLDERRGGAQLFRTTLEKSLFSSPDACRQTIRNRIRRLQKSEDEYGEEIAALQSLDEFVERIDTESYGKYQRLLGVIKDDFEWNGRDASDRLVIFTERIATMEFLAENLARDLNIKDKHVERLHGGMSDVDQQRIVEDFGRDEAPVRLLVASDVASEGINLHFLCHRMIHFDIPWSLMVFQQRNGRIDRFGQEHVPHIAYLITDSQNEKVRGDNRILEILIEKEDQAYQNIGDPAMLMNVYDVEEEERITGQAIEEGEAPDEFEKKLQGELDPFSILMGEAARQDGDPRLKIAAMPSLFASNFDYVRAALEQYQSSSSSRYQIDFYDEEQRVDLVAPDELRERFKRLPREIWPEDGNFVLVEDVDAIQEEISRCRKEEIAWPQLQYLWELHPVVGWIGDKVLSSFRRQEAPVLNLSGILTSEESIFIITALIPNRKGHPLLHRWFCVRMDEDGVQDVETFTDLSARIGLGSERIPNPSIVVNSDKLHERLGVAIEWATVWMSGQRTTFEKAMHPRLLSHLEQLARLRERQLDQLGVRFDETKGIAAVARSKREQEERRIEKLFSDYERWIHDTMETEDKPYLQVVAVLIG